MPFDLTVINRMGHVSEPISLSMILLLKATDDEAAKVAKALAAPFCLFMYKISFVQFCTVSGYLPGNFFTWRSQTGSNRRPQHCQCIFYTLPLGVARSIHTAQNEGTAIFRGVLGLSSCGSNPLPQDTTGSVLLPVVFL